MIRQSNWPKTAADYKRSFRVSHAFDCINVARLVEHFGGTRIIRIALALLSLTSAFCGAARSSWPARMGVHTGGRGCVLAVGLLPAVPRRWWMLHGQ